MPAVNRIELMGNLTKDPEVRYTQNETPVVNFGLAVNRVRSKNEHTDFFDCAAWREMGTNLAHYKGKGDLIYIAGRLEQQTWQAQDGTNRSRHVVVAEEIQYLPSGNGNGSSGNGASGGASGGSRQGPVDNGGEFDEEESYDDIPFRQLNARRRVVSDIL